MAVWYDFPIRGDYGLNFNIDIVLEGGIRKVNRKLEYKQATIIETIVEMDKIDKIGMDKYFNEVLKGGGFTDDELLLLSMQPDTLRAFLAKYLSTRFRGVIDESDIMNPQRSITESKGVPYEAMLVKISEKLFIDPLLFQEKYTFEQMRYLVEGIEYWVNMQTEEGQIKNKKKYERNEDYDSMLLEQLRNV